MPEVLIKTKSQGRKANEIFTHYVDQFLKQKGYITLLHQHGGITVIRFGKKPLVLCISLKGRMVSGKWEEAMKLGAVDIGIAFPRYEIVSSGDGKYILLHLDEPVIKIGLSKTHVYNIRLPRIVYVPEDFEAEAIEKAGRIRRPRRKLGEELESAEISGWKIFEKS
jgi:hypothetical protein